MALELGCPRQGTQNMGNATASTTDADCGPRDVAGSLIVRTAGASGVAFVDDGRDQGRPSGLVTALERTGSTAGMVIEARVCALICREADVARWRCLCGGLGPGSV